MINKSRTPLYNCWVTMRQRCNNLFNPKYPRYGARGIKVCEEWNSFENFKTWAVNNGYEFGLTLDRENNNEGYNPSNCRWVTPKIQSNNTRRNIKLQVYGEIKTVAEWTKDSRCSVNDQTIYKRLNNGWAAHDAISQPLYKRRPQYD